MLDYEKAVLRQLQRRNQHSAAQPKNQKVLHRAPPRSARGFFRRLHRRHNTVTPASCPRCTACPSFEGVTVRRERLRGGVQVARPTPPNCKALSYRGCFWPKNLSHRILAPN